MKYMYFTLILVSFLFSSIALQAQQGKQVQLFGKITELNVADSCEKPAGVVDIEIYGDGRLIEEIKTTAKGKYLVVLPYHRTYVIKYGKAPYVRKMVEVDAADFMDEGLLMAFAMQIDMALFKNNNYRGLDFLNEIPVAKAKYKKKLNTVQFDDEYSKQLNTRVLSVLMAYSK